jgi:serine/threonine protein kinase
MDDEGNPKLSDFGYCKTESVVGDDQKGGTLFYAAPELLRPGRDEPYRADIWGLGVLLFSIHTAQFPYSGKNPRNVAGQILCGHLLYEFLNDEGRG